MELLNNIEVFSLKTNRENNWEKWIKRFDNFPISSGITDDARKKALFRHCVGKDALPEPMSTSTRT